MQSMNYYKREKMKSKKPVEEVKLSPVEYYRQVLVNIHDILIGYDGYKGSAPDLEKLIDEVREMASSGLQKKSIKYENSLKDLHIIIDEGDRK
jgi:hypothetical protein